MEPSVFDDFQRDGFTVLRNVLDPARLAALRDTVQQSVDPPLAPIEFEADVAYPGSPESQLAVGGQTPRRLLHAYGRDAIFRALARDPDIVAALRTLMDGEGVCVSQNHHNCVMTKMPGFSSETQWHQDIRYWRFDRPELISVWVALGDERVANGALRMIPGSHRMA
ncbi:MAG: phytanoyl-CoA dioxygenase family protein, partial [Pseudomonadota bacterium]